MASWFTTVGSDAVLFPFVRLEGTPVPVRREVQIVTRPGIDNFGEKIGGILGPEYSITTYVDCVSVGAADATIASYLAARNSTLRLWWQGRLWHACRVNEVIPNALQVGSVGVGGLNGGAVELSAVWKLRGIA